MRPLIPAEELYSQALTSAYTSALRARFIAPEMNLEAFKSRFFYMFIERFHSKDKPFAKDLFEEGEKNYALSMAQSFTRVFEAVATGEELNFELIDEVHNLALGGVEDFPNRFRKSYTTDGVTTRIGSKEFFAEIARDNHKLRLNSLGGVQIGKHVATDFYGFVRTFNEASSEKIENTLRDLIAAYEEKIGAINADEPSPAEEKLKAIIAFCRDLSSYHPYMDGNSRIAGFLMINFLLLKEKLPPCMLATPFHLDSLTVEQNLISLKEGQLAFQKFFLNGEKLDNINIQTALSEELQNIRIRLDSVKNIRNLAKEFFTFYLLLTELSAIPEAHRDSESYSFCLEQMSLVIKNLKQNDIEDLHVPLLLKTEKIFDDIVPSPEQAIKKILKKTRRFPQTISNLEAKENMSFDVIVDLLEKCPRTNHQVRLEYIRQLDNMMNFTPEKINALKETSTTLEQTKTFADLATLINQVRAKFLPEEISAAVTEEPSLAAAGIFVKSVDKAQPDPSPRVENASAEVEFFADHKKNKSTRS